MAIIAEPEYLETGALARGLGVAAETIRWWERSGKITPVARTSTGRMLFTHAQADEIRAWRAAQREAEPPRDAA
jgi:DNA-binding transcriptional MerR regulator